MDGGVASPQSSSNELFADGNFTISHANAYANPFKQVGQGNYQKHKSVQGSFSGRVSNQGGFKIPDSSSPFAFQPHKNIYGGAGAFGSGAYPMAMQQSMDDAPKSFPPWDAKERSDKQGPKMDGVFTEAFNNSINKKISPFVKQSQKYQNDQSSNFGDFEGKNKNKTQYQAINRQYERHQHFGEENKSGVFKGKNNRMHIDFEHQLRKETRD